MACCGAFLALGCEDTWLMYEVMYGSSGFPSRKFVASFWQKMPPSFIISCRNRKDLG